MSKELKTLEILTNLTKSVDTLRKSVDYSHERIDCRTGRLDSQQDQVKVLEEKVSSFPLLFCVERKEGFSRLLLLKESYRDLFPYVRSFSKDLAIVRQGLLWFRQSQRSTSQ